MEMEMKSTKIEEVVQNKDTLTQEEIKYILKYNFHNFEKLVGRKMTYAEERDHGEMKNLC